MKLIYEFSEDEFISYCVHKIQRDNTTIFEDIYEAVAYFLSSPVDSESIFFDVKHQYNSEYYDKHLSLTEYIENGFIEFYYPTFDLYSKIEHTFDIEDVYLPNFINLLSFNYGDGVTKKIKVKNHKLKTKNRVTIELLHLTVNQEILVKISNLLHTVNINLIPSKLNVWEWRQTFYNKISGESFLCKCFENAINIDGLSLSQQTHQHVKKALQNYSFKENICHMCRNINSDLFYCSPMYCSSFKVKYGAYIKKIEIERSLDKREAENMVREMKGVAKIGERWINETLLFNYIDLLFPNYKVHREASPSWLGNQRLDIFIPDLGIAIEYQGEQHFKSVELFGGKEGLQKTKERDIDKLLKCKNNKIDLIYFTYKDDLSEKLVQLRLKKYLPGEGI